MAAAASPDEWNEALGLPGVLGFDEPHPGMVRARVTTPACSAELYLQGAQLTAWQPTGAAPVLFLSAKSEFAPGKPIRGGVPVIFPWFGAPAHSPIEVAEDAPSHGFARVQTWTPAFAALSGEELHLTLTLGPSELSRSYGFDHFQLAYTLVLGRELRLQLAIANRGETPLHCEEALHSYLAVGDARQIALLGLGDTAFLDKTDGFARKVQKETVLRLTGETDRPYLNTQVPVLLEDPVLGRRITVSKSNSHSTVIWNPWAELAHKLADLEDDAWPRMTCVETANVADDALTLAPQQAHTLEAHLRLEPLVPGEAQAAGA